MRPKKIEDKVIIPQGIEVTQEGPVFKVKGPKGEQSRKLAYRGVTVARSANEIIFTTANPTKREKKALYTMVSHLRNMVEGSKSGYVYKLKVCPGHFPPTVKVEGKDLVVSNFLGGKIPKVAPILDGVKVTVQGDNITVEGHDLEKVSQTAGNIEISTRIVRRDRRVFQAGIFITEKAGKPIR